MSIQLADLRRSYERFELDEHSTRVNPTEQFEFWLSQAIEAQVPEPTAMTLATVGADGRPSTRVVLLKGLSDDGLVWYTNYQSRKGLELAGNAHAALQFHWVELERVVRVEGVVTMVSAAMSDAYFASRPLDSRLGAWASPQSQVVASRHVLVTNAAQAATTHGDHPPRPPHWGGYRLMPDRWEFWQGRKSRLHDRLRYQRQGPVQQRPASDQVTDVAASAWLRERLAP